MGVTGDCKFGPELQAIGKELFNVGSFKEDIKPCVVHAPEDGCLSKFICG